jgi:hypothetical protein
VRLSTRAKFWLLWDCRVKMVELFEEGLVVQVSNTKVDRKSGTRSLELFMKMFFTGVCGGNFWTI